MANNLIQFKRTSTTGLGPNTTNAANNAYIPAGSFAVNLTDKKVFGSDGTNAFDVGSNVSTLFVTSNSVSGNVSYTNLGFTFQALSSIVQKNIFTVPVSGVDLIATQIQPTLNQNAVDYQNLMGLRSSPIFLSSNASTFYQGYGAITNAFRDQQNDEATAELYGSYAMVGHTNANTAKVYNTSSAQGSYSLVLNYQGSITDSYGYRSQYYMGVTAAKTANGVNHYGVHTSGTVGAASGGTKSLTNYYDAYFGGVTTAATGVVTNKYGVYQVKTDHINYFAGNTGIGNSTPAHKLSIGGTLAAGNTTITGDLTVTGNTTLGDAAADNITINGNTITITANASIDAGTLFIDSVNNRVGFSTNSTNLTDTLVVAGRARIDGTNKLTFGYSTGGYAGIGISGATTGTLLFTTYDGATIQERMRINYDTGNTGIGNTAPLHKFSVNGTGYFGNNLTVSGAFAATTKSFLIDHPTKEGMKLRYGSLEGPENGVYVRGRLTGSNTIELPDYWTGLIDEESITVNLTPIGSHQNLFVKDTINNKIIVGNENLLSKEIDCFYTVFAERNDVEKLLVEYKEIK